MYILTVEQMRRAEAAANAAGQTYELMMERAGQAVATAVRQTCRPEGLRVLVLVGPGNNGGDGLVAAYHLNQMGADVACYIWKREKGDAHLTRAANAGCRILWAEEDPDWKGLTQECESADVVVDALLGTGVTRPISGSLAGLLERARMVIQSRRRHRIPEAKQEAQLLDPTWWMPSRLEDPKVIAVDVPSGLDCDTGAADPLTLPADITVTFGFPKRGQFAFPGAALIGKLLVADIGIPPLAIENCHLHLVTSQMVAERLPARPLDAHKGTFGRALIVAGSVNYTGAPALAACAAMRVGAGLVTLALAESIYPIVAGKLLEPTYFLLPHSLGVISPDAVRVLYERLGMYQALLIGPGLSQEKEVVRFVHEFFAGKEWKKAKARGRIGFMSDEPARETEKQEETVPAWPPLVIDADALNALAQEEEWPRMIPAGNILTPHPGEMARLLRRDRDAIQADRIGTAQEAAKAWNQIVLLKGAYTVIASPDGETYILPFANPVLATAGTGDVLAGAIVGLLAQGLQPLDAAIVGGFLHGLAAEELAASKNQSAGSIAGDLLPFLPAAIQRLRT